MKILLACLLTMSLSVWAQTDQRFGSATVSDLQGTDPEMASTVWASLDAVTNGLGGGNEVLGGIWVLGISVVALRERLFARWINYLGVVMGVSALLTIVPALEDVGAVFGLGLIVWFVAVGITLIKDHANSTPSPDHQESSTAIGA